jgi:mono/diheme cytochrome c family protein
MSSIPVGFLAVFFVSVGLSAQPIEDRDTQARRNPWPRTTETVALGRQVFVRNCQVCHGPTARGGPSPDSAPDLTRDNGDRQATDGELFSTIKVSPAHVSMRASADPLTDTDIWYVVNFLRMMQVKR